MTTAPWQLDANQLAGLFAQRVLSPVDALYSVLTRLETVNPRLNAVIARDDAASLIAAHASEQRWQRGAALSALDGVPMTVKDNIPVAGLPCAWGSRLHAGQMATRDESPVERLRNAGAILIGKTNVPEFTLQGYTDNALFGPTRNPWDLDLTPGGSSGGAVAAVAAGIGPLALATDGGGSIRRPCAYTGLVGLKPSWGRVPRQHGLPEMLPGLEVIGPIARTMTDLARFLHVIAPTMPFPNLRSADAGGPLYPPAAGSPAISTRLRIAFWRAIAGSPVDTVIDRRIRAVARQFGRMGHEVIETEPPAEVDDFNRKAWPVLSATGLAAVLRGHDAEALTMLTPAMNDLRQRGSALTAVDLFDAQRRVRALRTALDEVFRHVDVILTPACAAMPWPAHQSHPESIDGRAVDARGHAVFTAFVNGAGLPALSLPAHRDEDDSGGDGKHDHLHDLPIGCQLIGQRGDDRRLIELGHALEQRHRPPYVWTRRGPMHESSQAPLHESPRQPLPMRSQASGESPR